MEPTSGGEGAAVARRTPGIERGTAVNGAIAALFLAIVLFALPSLLGAEWVTTFTSVAIYSVVAAGLGILYGRVGMISLGQIAILGIGAWTATRLSYATGLPFPLLLVVTGVITCAVGVLIGLPALRLTGLYLALITLMAAGAVTLVLTILDVPNGGGGFAGHRAFVDTSGIEPVRRPAMAVADTAFYRYVVIVSGLMFLLAFVHVVGKPGRAWAAIRESEPAALAAGVNITLYKMWACALASFMTGIAGCLLAAQVGYPTTTAFPVQNSLVLLATAMIGGIFTLRGAIVAGVFYSLVPFILNVQLGINSNFLFIIFGIGLIQVLLTAPGGIVQQFPKDMANLGRLIARGARALGGGRGKTA